MSWFTGASLAAGSLVDMAGTIPSIVAQQRQIDLMAEANRIQANWVRRQEALQIRGQDISRDLAVNGTAQRVESLVNAGFTPVDARRLAGGTETVSYGLLDRPILQRGVLSGITETRHLQTMQGALSAFKSGASYGAPPAPSGFVNPNYQPSPPRLKLGPRPPSTNV
uniref:Minor structural protein n=1 Tax=Sapovirus Hu/Chiba/990727/1999 TaxID=255222 RepID=Q0E805_9CALI|nr:minor structural protein [Sapovirus Hu/Chiba/990727/1999]